jgi:triphosphoribosyl-dephospho-CoA synthase
VALTDRDIAQAIQIACLLEAAAEKPGNISPGKSFNDLNYNHFLFSAAAVFPAFLNIEEKGVGEIVYKGIKETHSLIDTNTNLGILLLTAPLASAYVKLRKRKKQSFFDYPSMELEKWHKEKENKLNAESSFLKELRKELHLVLNNLDKKDAEFAYQAINFSKAGNLDKVEKGDIADNVDLNLYDAMKLAENRDNIAFEYVNDYSIIFDFAYPRFITNMNKIDSIDNLIIKTFIEILAEYPDSLIARKYDFKTAEQISLKTGKLLKKLENFDIQSKKAENLIAEFDKYLRSQKRKFNPGTTADIITAVIFLSILVYGKKIIKIWSK